MTMPYGLKHLAALRNAGYKPKAVIVRLAETTPAEPWWVTLDTMPTIVISGTYRLDDDDLMPLTGLEVIVYSEHVTDALERLLDAVRNVALSFVLISPALDDTGFCWHRVHGEKLLGEKLLGEKYAMAT